MSVTEIPTDQAPPGDTPPIDRADGHPGPDPADGSGRRPSFTITDAAVACAVSRKTITRKLADLAIHGAAKDDDGIWRIPVEALLAVGLHPGRSVAEEPRPQPTVDLRRDRQDAPSTPAADTVTIPRERWDDIRIRLARAEAEASERALALADARLALRALTAGPASGSGPAATTPAPADAGAGAFSHAVSPHDPTGSAGGQRDAAPIALPSGGPGGPASSQAHLPEGWVPGDADLFSARSHAARNAGFPPAPAVPVEPAKRRRWWQTR